MTKSLAIVVLPLFAISCAREIVNYPPNWAPTDSRLGCSAVAGAYQQKGERAPGGVGGSFLSFTHLMTYNEVDFWGPSVMLSFPETEVFLMKAGGERRYRFKEREVVCNKGKLELRRSDRGATMLGPSRYHVTVTLTRSTDGWLIANWERAEWIFILGFIPTYSLVRDWYRFQPVAASQEIQSMTGQPVTERPMKYGDQSVGDARPP